MCKKKLFGILSAVLLLSGCSASRTETDKNAIKWLEEKESEEVVVAMSLVSEAKSERESRAAEALAKEEEAKRIKESIRASEEAESIAESEAVEASKKAEESMSIAQEQYIASSEAESRLLQAIEESKEEEYIKASLEAESIAASIAESSALQSSVDASIAQSIAESRYIEESLAAETANQIETLPPDESAIQEYLSQLTAGTNIIPGGVNKITDSDLYIIHELYRDTVVIGDSRAEGAVWVLAGSEVYYARGAHAASKDMHEKALEAARMYPKKALFWLGLNDMGIHGANVEQFVADYEALIREFLSIDSTCQIYVQNITPIGQKGIEKYPNSVYSDAYSQAIYDMCVKNGWNYLDANTYFDMSYYASDGLHYNKIYYQYWVQDAAVKMGLWGDLVR